MIVTRSWLEEYVDLEGISNEELTSKLNNIGLEVDEVKEINIPKNVVVGKVISCIKHPNADKLNFCRVDVGDEVLDIVCGASNVKDAEFVAVAKIGAVLPGDFEIKKANIRGMDSYGMICSSSELGLPELDEGIMILDDSIGELVIGKELREYKKINDTIIGIDLTANRGDCQSIYGVARDLSAAFKRELFPFEFFDHYKSKIGIAREVKVNLEGEFDGAIEYNLFFIDKFNIKLLTKLRDKFVELDAKDEFDYISLYAAHSSG
ncbi:MAG: phenylalanine--tRNA ligase subunit beta, partial [Epsilonproteobacteria bacterium]|nr:phenylalanine--tRNA ligase subunit beta [Campylobacterota bacterium]